MLLRSILLATVVATVFGKDSYVVVVPKSFRAGVPLSVSVNLLQASADVKVTASLVNKGTSATVAKTTGTFSQGHPGSLTIQVPDDVHSGSYVINVNGSGGATFSNSTSIGFESKSISIFIQTDKAMYKPGQTVNFRAFAVFPNLTVYTGPMDVDIYDPNTNKIKQWKGLSDASGVLTKLMVMDTQPVLGDWRIHVAAHGRSMDKSFTVAHYVLPKFEVTVELPSYALTSDATVSGKVKAKYTYGKPVRGSLSLKAEIDPWYRPYHYTGEEPKVTMTSMIDGEASFDIPIAHIKTIARYIRGHSLKIEANVTESLNNITLSGSGSVEFYDTDVKLEFLSSNPKTFKPGLQYTAYLKVVQQDGVPLTAATEMVNVTTTVTSEEKAPTTTPYPWFTPTQHYNDLAPHTFSVPDTGVVPVQVTIPENATHITLRAHYGKVQTTLSLSKSYSPSDSYMQMSLKSANLRAGDFASFDIKSIDTLTDMTYQVMSRGTIVSAGGFSGNSFSLQVTGAMAPSARIIMYYVRPDGEVVTDSISFDVDGVFKNKVSLSFDKKKAQPGESVNVMVTADPNSLVNLLAVDQSVLLLKSGNDITSDQVVTELKSYDTIPSHNSPFDMPMPIGFGRKKRMIWWPYPVYYGGSDAQQIFDNAGVKVMTDALVFHHYEQPIYYFNELKGSTAGGGKGEGGVTGGVESIDHIRTAFPETRLCDNATTRYIMHMVSVEGILTALYIIGLIMDSR